MECYSLDGAEWIYTSRQKPLVQLSMLEVDVLEKLEKERDIMLLAYRLHSYEIIKKHQPLLCQSTHVQARLP
jgi:hypothetical protein